MVYITVSLSSSVADTVPTKVVVVAFSAIENEYGAATNCGAMLHDASVVTESGADSSPQSAVCMMPSPKARTLNPYVVPHAGPPDGVNVRVAAVVVPTLSQLSSVVPIRCCASYRAAPATAVQEIVNVPADNVTITPSGAGTGPPSTHSGRPNELRSFVATDISDMGMQPVKLLPDRRSVWRLA